MEAAKHTNRLHPLVAVAAVSVTLASLTGIAALTGILPTSHGTNSPLAEPAPIAKTDLSEDKAQAAIDPAKLQPEKSSTVTEKPSKTAAPKEEKPVRVAARQPTATPSMPTTPSSYDSGTSPAADYSQRRVQTARASYCDDCGRIETIDAMTQAAAPSGLGIAAGAVIGGLLGNQIGDGSGRKIATVAGAVGGGYAGNEVEKRTRTATSYEIRVRMEDGSVRTIPQSKSNGWQVGDRVRIVNGGLVSDG